MWRDVLLCVVCVGFGVGVCGGVCVVCVVCCVCGGGTLPEVSLRRAGIEQLYQGKRMIGGIGSCVVLCVVSCVVV